MIINFLKGKNKFFITGLFIVVFMSLIPFFSISIKDKKIPTIFPEIVDDSLYYYARINDVSRGHLLIGNPYFFEHRDDIAPAFFVPDWIAGAPLFVGFNINTTIILDTMIWVGVFYSLIYLLLKKIDNENNLTALYSSIVTLCVLWLLFRPVSLQIVFPFFCLYLLLFYNWLLDSSSRKKSLFFALISGLSFYIYSYLWQFSVIVLFILFFGEIYKRNKEGIKNVLFVGIGALITATFFFQSLYIQLSNRYFWESMTRLGLVFTHSIGYANLICLGLVFVGLTLSHFLFGGVKHKFFIIVGSALGILSISTVVTGKDLETAVHVLNFIDLWLLVLVFSSATVIYNFYLKKLNYRKILILSLVIISLARFSFLLSNSVKRIIFYKNVEDTSKLEPIFSFIKTNVPEGSVIMADDLVSSYIPVYTNNYVLFHPSGGLQLVSDSEVYERYSISRIGNLDQTKLMNDMRLFRGVGPSEHIWKVNNRLVNYCNAFKFVYSNIICGPSSNRETYYGDAYFNNLYRDYSSNVQPNIKTLLSKYNVKFVIIDSENNQFNLPKEILKKIIYKDQEFTIFSL